MPSTVRVAVYIHRDIAEAIRKAYPESRSLGEAVQLLVYEVLAGEIERRNWDKEVTELAKALLVLRRSKKK